jgi:hypothetical protein
MKTEISVFEGYKGLLCFLEQKLLNEPNHHRDTIPYLLGSMQFLSDGTSADTAMFLDWQRLCNSEADLDTENAYKLAFVFIGKFSDAELENLLAEWFSESNMADWLMCVGKNE